MAKNKLSIFKKKKYQTGLIIKPIFLLISTKIGMKNIIILEEIEMCFGIVLQAKLIRNKVQAF